MIASESGTDWTVRMLDWSGTRARGLGDLDLSGYILKSKSPSCGIDDVKIHSSHRSAGRRKRGGGIFATVFMNQHPLVPVADERRLSDPAVRENFIVRVFAYRRLQRLLRGRFTVRRLQEFHASEELLLMAHNPARCRTLGRLVASAGTLPASELKVRYAARFMRCLETPSTPANHALVLRKLAARLPRSRRVGQLLRQSYFSPYPEEFNFADPG
jgi:uncharacterized protein YbgA (DUF1722 family)